MTDLQSWIGREERQTDVVDAVRAQRMHAFLDRSVGEVGLRFQLPHGYHWLYCVRITPRAEWGHDGHVRPGGFLPRIEGTRRMWAGGSLQFLQPVIIGESVERQSVIQSIDQKEGRNGSFFLVHIEHR